MRLAAMRGRRCPAAPKLVLPPSRCISVAITCLLFGFDATAATVEVVPSITLRTTLTENSSSGLEGEAGVVTEVAPSINISMAGPKVNGNVNAGWRNTFSSKGGEGRQSFITLSSNGSYSPVEDRVSVEFSANVSRNNLDLFQGKSQWDEDNSDENAEVRHFSITPRLRQRFGNVTANASYQIQFLSSASNLSNQGNGALKINIAQEISGSRLGWRLDYTRADGNTYGSTANNQVHDTGLTGTLSYQVDPHVSIYGRIGQESNNYSSKNSKDGITKGFGATWVPTPRTTISGDRGYHTYGDTYNLKMSHRFSRIALDFGFSKSVSSAFQSATNSLAAYYYNLFSNALLAAYPDPVERQRVVISLIKALGIPVGPGFGAFNTNAYFLERQFNSGVTLIGARNTLALSLFRSNRESLTNSGDLSTDDDFQSNKNLKTLGATLSLSHKLTPNTGLNGSIFWTKASGDGGEDGRDNRRLGLSVGANTKFGAKTTGVLTFRRERSNSESGFTENSLTAAVTMNF